MTKGREQTVIYLGQGLENWIVPREYELLEVLNKFLVSGDVAFVMWALVWHISCPFSGSALM